MRDVRHVASRGGRRRRCNAPIPRRFLVRGLCNGVSFMNVVRKLKATMPNPDQLDPKDIYFISDLETLKVVSDPLRLRILECFRGVPATVKDVAAALDMPPTRLYYHVNQLEERGLIHVVETRVVSGIIEKHYQTTAYRLTVDHD